MEENVVREVWLRGPVPGITPLLQPVAHAMLQSMEEIRRYCTGLAEEMIWMQPAGSASVAFHLKHTDGFLDRLFTYASGSMLSGPQLLFLSKEGEREETDTSATLIARLQLRVDLCMQQLSGTSPESLTELRYVGRKKIESTVAGLLFHAAEHMSRHTGQILVTARFVKAR